MVGGVIPPAGRRRWALPRSTVPAPTFPAAAAEILSILRKQGPKRAA